MKPSPKDVTPEDVQENVDAEDSSHDKILRAPAKYFLRDLVEILFQQQECPEDQNLRGILAVVSKKRRGFSIY